MERSANHRQSKISDLRMNERRPWSERTALDSDFYEPLRLEYREVAHLLDPISPGLIPVGGLAPSPPDGAPARK